MLMRLDIMRLGCIRIVGSGNVALIRKKKDMKPPCGVVRCGVTWCGVVWSFFDWEGKGGQGGVSTEAVAAWGQRGTCEAWGRKPIFCNPAECGRQRKGLRT